jgi:predicted alpha/beta-fold hydrolase
MAVCPPIDLAACSRQISKASNRMYDRHFVSMLLRQMANRGRLMSDAASVTFVRRPRTLWEFDDKFTAVVCGFGTADDYYRLASSVGLISRICTPTLILASRDDPMIPCEALEQICPPPAVRVHLSNHGGHLGFVGRAGIDPDRRWMDWRVVEWVLGRDAATERAGPSALSARGGYT